MLRFVEGLDAEGITNLNNTLQEYALRASRSGLCFLITDLFAPDGYLDGLNALLGNGFEVALIHVLSADEVTPVLNGDLRLIDVETGHAQEVSLDATMRDLYIERFQTWQASIRQECGRRGVHYVLAQTDTPVEQVILHDLRRIGVVK